MKGWGHKFDDPIPLPGGGDLKTLRDAGTYISELPKRKHDTPEWQAAIEVLMLVAETGGPTMLARIGIMQALNAANAKHPKPPRRKPTRRYRVVSCPKSSKH